MTKTCGECKVFELDEIAAICHKHCLICNDDAPACEDFELKVITNGDKIRQMSNADLARKFGYPCPPIPEKHCKGINNEECTECWLNWLNAPAESEGEDEL